MSTSKLHGAAAHIYPGTPPALAAAKAALEAEIAEGKYLVVDVETTGYDLEDARFAVRTIQLGTSEAVVVLDGTDPDQCALAREAIAAAPRLTAHNADYDFVSLARVGIVADLHATYARVEDTYAAAMLVSPSVGGGEVTRGKRYGLKPLAEAFAGERAVSARARETLEKACKANKWGSLDPKDYGPSAWSELDAAESAFIAYAAADIIDGSLVAERLLPLVRLTVPAEVWERERRLACEAAMMRYRGIRLDRQFTAEQLAAQERIVAEAEAEIDEVLADIDFDSTGHKPYSPNHLAAAVIDGEGLERTLTEKGEIATGRAVLAAWEAAGSRIAGPWQRRKDAAKLASTYYGRYLRAGSDRIHPTLIPLKASTGRMASEAPNFQNLPARDASVHVRECFLAADGNVFISADFSSVEMRVAASVTGDPALTAMYTTDLATVEDPRTLDPYWVLAFELCGAEATKTDRQMVKTIVLGRMYGGGAATLAENAGVAESRVNEVLRTYDTTYIGLAPWAKEHIEPLCQAGRSWWQLPSGRYQWINPGHAWKALNTIIQGYSRDILADALLRVADDPDLGPGLVMPIHDELLVQVPADRADELMARLVERMSTTVGSIPIPAEGAVLGRRWVAK